MIRNIEFYRDNQKIFGELFIPDSLKEKKKFPVVILCHGFSGTHRKVSGYTKRLIQEGMAVYAFDFCGGGEGCQSDGTSLNMSVLTNLKDLETVLEGIRKQDFCDPANVFLMGESQGGLACALAAGRHVQEVNSLVLFYPAFNIPEVCRKSFPDPASVPDTYETLGMKIGRKYYEDAVNLDVWKQIRPYDHNVLIVHGTNDHIVPYEWSQKALQVYKHASLIPVEGSDHGFYGEDEVRSVHLAAAFMKENFQ